MHRPITTAQSSAYILFVPYRRDKSPKRASLMMRITGLLITLCRTSVSRTERRKTRCKGCCGAGNPRTKVAEGMQMSGIPGVGFRMRSFNVASRVGMPPPNAQRTEDNACNLQLDVRIAMLPTEDFDCRRRCQDVKLQATESVEGHRSVMASSVKCVRG